MNGTEYIDRVAVLVIVCSLEECCTVAVLWDYCVSYSVSIVLLSYVKQNLGLVPSFVSVIFYLHVLLFD